MVLELVYLYEGVDGVCWEFDVMGGEWEVLVGECDYVGGV